MIVVALCAIVLILILAVVVLAGRTRRLGARLHGMTRGADEGSLETVLASHLDSVTATARDVADVVARMTVLEGRQQMAFQRVGLVRFNPFEDTGGNQSFALALLDVAGNGWILSSLHARSGTRVYAKAVSGGKADSAVSDEELAAIRQAMV